MTAWRYASFSHRREARAVLMERQGGRCAGCFQLVAVLQLDHDHDTGLIRGLLCPACNVGEGHGRAFAWDLYVAETPASLPDAVAVLASFVRRCEQESARADEAVRAAWRSGFHLLARRAMDRKFARFDQWQGSHPRPDDPEMQEWQDWTTDLYRRAEAAAAEAVTIDHSKLGALGVTKSDIEGFIRDIGQTIAFRLDRKDSRRREERLRIDMADALPAHPYLEGERKWNDDTNFYEHPCQYPGCGIDMRDHPLKAANQDGLVGRAAWVRAQLADLTGALQAVA